MDPTQNLAGAIVLAFAHSTRQYRPVVGRAVFRHGASGWRGWWKAAVVVAVVVGRRVARSSMILRHSCLAYATIHPTDEFSGFEV